MMAMGFTTQEQFDESLRRMKAPEGGMGNARMEMFMVGLGALQVAIDCDDPKRELLVRINDLISEAQNLPPAQEWQDISTAPKDGTPILIWEPGPHSFGNREQDREYGPDGNFTGVICEYDDKRWAIGYWRPWGGWGNRNSHDVNPTHW